MKYIYEIGDKIYNVDRDEFCQHKLRVFSQFIDKSIMLVNGCDEKGEYFIIKEALEKEPSLLESKFSALAELKAKSIRMENHAVFVYKKELDGSIYQKAYRFDLKKIFPLMLLNEYIHDNEINYVIDKFVVRSLNIHEFYNRKKKEIFGCKSIDELSRIDYSEFFHLHSMSH